MQPAPKQTRQQRRAEKREFDKAVARIDRHGLDCCGGTPFTIHPTVIVRTEGKAGVEVWHTGCLAQLPDNNLRKIVGIHHANMAEQPWVAHDRQWFLDHPDRSGYFRKPIGEEWEAALVEHRLKEIACEVEPLHEAFSDESMREHRLVAVTQIKPGERSRELCFGNHGEEDEPQPLNCSEEWWDAMREESKHRISAGVIGLSVTAKVFGLTEEDVLDKAAAKGAAAVINKAKGETHAQ